MVRRWGLGGRSGSLKKGLEGLVGRQAGRSFGGLLRFVPPAAGHLVPSSSQIYSDAILQLVLSGCSQPGGQDLQVVDQPGEGMLELEGGDAS